MTVETEKPKTVVPFIYKGYKLYPIRKADLKKYIEYVNRFSAKKNDIVFTEEDYSPIFNYYLEKYKEHHNQAFFIFKDNEMVGEVFVIDLIPHQTAYVTLINLLEEHRGIGIGTGVMNLIETVALQAKCSYLSLIVEKNNERVMSFYERLGFTQVSSSDDGWTLRKNLLFKKVSNR